MLSKAKHLAGGNVGRSVTSGGLRQVGCRVLTGMTARRIDVGVLLGLNCNFVKVRYKKGFGRIQQKRLHTDVQEKYIS